VGTLTPTLLLLLFIIILHNAYKINKNSKRENSLGYGSLNLFMCNFKWCIIIIILVIELNKESVIYIAKKLKLEGFCLSFF
jgi:hypothetical protein